MQNKTNRSRKLLISIGLLCGAIFGCLTDYSISHAKSLRPVRLGQPFNLKQGQEVWLRGTDLRIKLLGVADSRCPVNARCISAGNGVVTLDVSINRDHETLTVNTGSTPALPNEQNYRGYKISLVALNPFPGTVRGPAAANHVATLNVTRSTDRRQAVTGSPFELKHGQQILLQDTDIELKLVEVTDSRCPRNVTCVWAGNGVVKLEASQRGRNRKILTLNTLGSSALPKQQSYAGYWISLVSLNPYPQTSGGIRPGEYMATLVVNNRR